MNLPLRSTADNLATEVVRVLVVPSLARPVVALKDKTEALKHRETFLQFGLA